jgi:5-methylcytosine-specific restriction endonuclease McrA
MARPRKGNRKKKNIVWFRRYGTATLAPCCKCGAMIRFKDATLEHVTARALGGRDEFSNWDISCFPCNNAHGEMVRRTVERQRIANTPTRHR